MIDRLTIDKILDAANIVDVVSDFVTLKRSGANLKGLCPFHDDRTPSFMVSPAKNICKCFACGVGGRPVDFIMKHEQLSFYDALRYLAKKYGIEIKEKELSPEEKQSQTDRDSMFILNDWAKEWFQHQLNDTPDGRAIGLAYFRNRGFRDDIIARFQLGFCPDKREQTLGADALKAGYQEKYLTNTIDEKDPRMSIGTGLCIKNENGLLRDRFHGRVIWPIFTMSGRVAGFGGRVLDAATKGVSVKYLNSPESIIYSKRKELFGLFQAREAIRKRDLCYLVEGYTDVMAMHQQGVENVVASSGTALTTDQIRLIHRMTDNITVIYDGDEAGIHASERGTDMLLSEGMNVKLLLLPDGDDPDSFARKHSASEYQQYLTEHQVDFIQYKTNHLMAQAKDDPTRLGQLVHSIATSIAAIPDEITRVLYTRQAAQKLQMEERLITDVVNEQRRVRQEEKRREAEREHRRIANTVPQEEGQHKQSIDTNFVATPAPGTAMQQSYPLTTPTIGGNPSAERGESAKIANLEKDLMQYLLTKGDTIICYTEDENGNEKPLTAIEYTCMSMQDYGIGLSSTLYERALLDGMQHIHDEGFNASVFYSRHPDPLISTLAFELGEKGEPLSKIYSNSSEEQRVDDTIISLVANIQLYYVQKELKSLIAQVMDPALKKDKETYTRIMSQFIQKKKIQEELVKKGGDRIHIY